MRGTRVWTAILWVERFLPAVRVVPNEGGMSRARRAGWVPLIVLPSLAIPTIMRERGVFKEMWPAWRVLIEDFVLLLAAMTLVAAVVAAGVAFRRQFRQSRRNARHVGTIER